MADSKKGFGLENILFVLTIIMCSIYFFHDTTDVVMVIVLAMWTLIPTIFTVTPLQSIIKRNDCFSSVVLNLKYSSFLFILGIFISRISTHWEQPPFPGSIILYSIMISGMLIIFSFGYYIVDYMYKRDRAIDNFTETQKRSNIKGFDELLKTIEETDANVLTVAGNLLSMKTDKGIRLLNKFLSKSKSNKLNLIIPLSSKQYLNEIKEKTNKLSNQIEGYICEPFWFLQGVVIIGKLIPNRDDEITPIGCFYYKSRLSNEETVSDEGIFIDLIGKESNNDFVEAVGAYHFLLNTLKYHKNQYEVRKVFTKRTNGHKDENHNPQIETINWTTI